MLMRGPPAPGLVPGSRDIFARARESVHATVGSAGGTGTRDGPSDVARQDHHAPIRLLADGLRRHAGLVPERDVVPGGVGIEGLVAVEASGLPAVEAALSGHVLRGGHAV